MAFLDTISRTESQSHIDTMLCEERVMKRVSKMQLAVGYSRQESNELRSLS